MAVLDLTPRMLSYLLPFMLLVCFWGGPAWAGFLNKQSLPFATFHLNSGQSIVSDEKGKVTIPQGSRVKSVDLRGPYFEVSKDDAPIVLKQIAGDLSVSATTETENRALTVWQTLHQTVITLQNILGRDFFEQVSFPIKVMVDFDEGCNAGWDGGKLLFFQGDKHCQASVYIKDIVVHEFGHALMDNLRSGGPRLETDFNEGMADLLAATLGNDPIIGEGFFKGYSPNYLRSLERSYVYPNDWRGTYSGALILSTFGYEVLNLLKENFAAEVAQKMFLEEYFKVPSLLSSVQGRALENAPKLIVQGLLDRPEIQAKPGLQIWFNELLGRHGLHSGDRPFQSSLTQDGILLSFPPNSTPGQELILTTSTGVKRTLSIDTGSNSKLVPYTIFSAAGACGRTINASATLYQAQARRSFAPLKLLGGQQVEFKSVALDLGAQRSIPDFEEGVLSIPYSVSLKNNEVLISAVLQSTIDHIFPEDLRLSIQAGTKIAPIERGVEERAMPNTFDLTPFISQNSRGSIVMQDIGKGFTGTAQNNKLLLTTLGAVCPAR